MTDGTVDIVEQGAVRTVTLNRGAKRNALNRTLIEGLEAAFGAEPGAAERVTVLRSNGPSFCAGLDLRERREGTLDSSAFERVLDAMEHYPLPIVARVQGDAIAGGNELALHCDFVVASTSASFGMSLAKIGLAPTWFLCKKLLEVAGPVTTREILLLGEPLPATRMHQLGVIARVAAPHELDSEVAKITQRLSRNAPLSLRAMKALIVREMQFRSGIEHGDVDEMVRIAGRSDDAKEGMVAILEGRQADFRGR